MRRFLLFATLITFVLAVLGACFGLGLAFFGPFHAGNALFPLQHFAEDKQALFIFNDTGKALYYLSLTERRAVDLANLSGTASELDALNVLDDELTLAEMALVEIPQSAIPLVTTRLAEVVERAEAALLMLSIVPVENPQTFTAVQAKLNILHTLVGESKIAHDQLIEKAEIELMLPLVLTGDDNSAVKAKIAMDIDPRSVIFPPGSAGAEHAFFPLTGQHSDLECDSCHTSGQFTGTPSQCTSCHINVKPADHFTGECGYCHTPISWRDIQFDHAALDPRNCQTCHNKDKLGNHYSGQCSSCHNTRAWKPANFNHQSVGTDCKSCHTKNKPRGHFSSQCSNCHNTRVWKPADFNHRSVSTDCKSCHTKNKPGGHFSGQCSSCHGTNAWRPANFNHSGQTDCQSCHSRPSNHFSGQCSSCHNNSAWEPASFNHSGQTDCKSCHSRPSNHFSGQCSSCHNNSAWEPANFNHSSQTDCKSCHSRPSNHFSGQCSSCHNNSAWEPASFNHSGQTDCKSCHSRPANHWSGQCSKCHSTNSWGGVQVNGHSFPIDHKKANGECSRCHPSNSRGYTCYNCHDRAKMEEKHAEKNIFDIASRCAECHPDGKD